MAVCQINDQNKLMFRFWCSFEMFMEVKVQMWMFHLRFISCLVFLFFLTSGIYHLTCNLAPEWNSYKRPNVLLVEYAIAIICNCRLYHVDSHKYTKTWRLFSVFTHLIFGMCWGTLNIEADGGMCRSSFFLFHLSIFSKHKMKWCGLK